MARPTAQSGNILFLILLAVVLFAALSYAVTQSTRGGGNNASGETVKTKAASIFQFLDQLDAAVLRMRTTGGFDINKISLEYMTVTYNNSPKWLRYNNANCTSNACKIFHTHGGGIPARTFEDYAVTTPAGFGSWTQPGYYDFVMMNWPYAGTSLNDIVIMISAIDPAVCAEINRALGITANLDINGNWIDASVPANWDNSAYTISGTTSQLLGKSTFATTIIGTGTGAYCNLHHLLVSR